MCAVRKNSADEFVLDRDYEINTVTLTLTEEKHTHDFAELVYTLGGTGVHIVDGTEYRVRGGDMLIINYGQSHTVIPEGSLHYVDIMLKPEYLDKALSGIKDLFLILRLHSFSDFSDTAKRDNVFLHFGARERQRMEFLLEWTAEEQKSAHPATDAVLHSSLTLLLSLVFRRMAENQNSRLCINDRLLQYIKQNCGGKISVSELARHCGYTAEHFSRLFKAYCGRTPLEYITECRVIRAKELLSGTDKHIEEIYADCGFSSRTAFFRHFSEKVGTTPLRFRKNQK